MDYASVAFGVGMEALEDSNMLVQLLGNQEHHNLEMPSFYMSHDDVVASHYSSSDVYSSLNCWGVGGCVSGYGDLNLENYHLDYSNHGGFVMDLLLEDEKSDSQEPLVEEPDFLAPPKRRLPMSESCESLDECVRQKRRVSTDVHKNVTPKRKKSKRNAEIEEQNTPVHKQTSSSSSSEDESCESQEITCDGGTTHSSKGSKKSRAGRATATDSQSLYARKRRERINQRLKILQNLVPNGTKVDISTMLEDAVQYVKFLQLQIKLLSSDDLWMYAPIASNGMTIGLDLKMSMPQ